MEKIVFRGERNPIVVSKLLEIFVEQELQEIDQKRRRFYPDLETVGKIISHVKDLIASDFVEASTSSNENSDEASEEQNDMREEFVENRCDYQNIPLRGSKRKIMINECNATIRSIQSALWYVKEEKILKHLTSLKEVLADITSDMSVDDKCGLPIQPDPPKKLRRDPDTDQPTKKYNKLPLNKQKKAFSGRDYNTEVLILCHEVNRDGDLREDDARYLLSQGSTFILASGLRRAPSLRSPTAAFPVPLPLRVDGRAACSSRVPTYSEPGPVHPDRRYVEYRFCGKQPLVLRGSRHTRNPADPSGSPDTCSIILWHTAACSSRVPTYSEPGPIHPDRGTCSIILWHTAACSSRVPTYSEPGPTPGSPDTCSIVLWRAAAFSPRSRTPGTRPSTRIGGYRRALIAFANPRIVPILAQSANRFATTRNRSESVTQSANRLATTGTAPDPLAKVLVASAVVTPEEDWRPESYSSACEEAESGNKPANRLNPPFSAPPTLPLSLAGQEQHLGNHRARLGPYHNTALPDKLAPARGARKEGKVVERMSENGDTDQNLINVDQEEELPEAKARLCDTAGRKPGCVDEHSKTWLRFLRFLN
ncbi:hypothetical protein LSTR_LSTR012133 [Laodelphax striatellus]|uniref:Uncharacterized protein n=1 Tax=Laodelphax striatellus TaxID=195883 RepID=A0A482XQH2_LAOST|nr:hypothetical protein LSTR_LSTR012133 [Laodelphax striatellus]